MKAPLRNITIDSQAFVYWYSSGSQFTLNLSPKHNKNIKITLIFQADPPEELSNSSWGFYDISAQYNETETIIHIAKPRHIAAILTYLVNERPEFWLQEKTQVIENAWTILEQMGYHNPQPVWIAEW